MVTRRALLWTCIMVPTSIYHWPQLVISLEGSQWIASLVVLIVWVAGCVDMNEMTGQPEGEHDHHD